MLRSSIKFFNISNCQIENLNLVNGFKFLRKISTSTNNMDLKNLVKRLEEYATSRIACDWDNVGLLVEPSETLQVKKALLTNDLTEPVLEEAIRNNVNLIISYHPPIFRPLKRLTQSEWKQRSIVKCIENRIAVYSPHTSWDQIDGGINDWLLKPFDLKKIESIEPTRGLETPNGFSKSVRINLGFGPSKDKLFSKVSAFDNIKFVSEKEIVGVDSIKQVEVEFASNDKGVVKLIELVNSLYDANVLATLRINDLQKPLMKNVGLGRIGYLSEPKSIKDVVNLVKSHLKMKTFRLALANGKTLDDKIKSVIAFAGSGSNSLNNVNADLIITGEYSHHEILYQVHRGVSVIVTDHTNTERGYLDAFKRNFSNLLAKYNESVELVVSAVDRDPLEYI